MEGVAPSETVATSRTALFYHQKPLYLHSAGEIVEEDITNIFVRYSGSPGRSVGELPECSQDMMIDFTKSYYQHFTPVKEWS